MSKHSETLSKPTLAHIPPEPPLRSRQAHPSVRVDPCPVHIEAIRRGSNRRVVRNLTVHCVGSCCHRSEHRTKAELLDDFDVEMCISDGAPKGTDGTPYAKRIYTACALIPLILLTLPSRPHIAQLVRSGGRAQLCGHERADRRRTGPVLGCSSAHASGCTRSALRLGRSRYRLGRPRCNFRRLEHKVLCLSFRKPARDVIGSVIRFIPVTSITIEHPMPAGRSAEATGGRDESETSKS